MKEILKLLYRRSMHRMFGNPAIGTFTGFLTVIFIIRTSVNLYFAYIISQGNAVMHYSQIASGWFLYLCSYFIICSSFSAFHISFALPVRSFICLTPEGKKFRIKFLKHAALARPMNIAVAVLAVTGFFIFSRLIPGFAIINFTLIITLSIVISFLVFRLIERLKIGMLEIQILESVFLVILVMLNPDVINLGGSVRFMIYGQFLHFDSLKVIIAGLLIVSSVTATLLVLMKIINIFNAKLHEYKRPNGPVEGWYLHFFKITYWLVLYLFIFPALLFDAFSMSAKQKIIAGFIIFNFISYIFFMLHCENILSVKLRRKILSADHIHLVAGTFMLHLVLTLIPVLATSIFRNGI